jgi:NAD(P)-dependent dehydrogenase (short-subunit alcohol dehydrogenase family)
MGELEGKVVVVTGASRGLGEAMAIGYARAGATLVLGARTTSDLERVADICRKEGAPSVTTVQTDVTDEAQIGRLVKAATDAHGRLDVFVANAGTSYAMLTDKRYGEVWTYDLDVAEKILRVNTIGTWLQLKAAIPAMTEGASFIAIGSETGRALYPRAGFYAVTKASIDALVTLASREAAASGIRVNVLSPGGMVDTQLFGPNGMPEFLKQQHPPLPADVIVPAAVWLASDASKDVTGALISGKEFNATGPEGVAVPAGPHGAR